MKSEVGRGRVKGRMKGRPGKEVNGGKGREGRLKRMKERKRIEKWEKGTEKKSERQ